MGSAESGKWIIGLTIYFFVFLVIVTYASNLDSNITYSGGEFANQSNSVNGIGCSTPRTAFNVQGEPYIMPGSGASDDGCEYTQGAFNEMVCDRINGCEWTNATGTCSWWDNLWGYCEDGDYSCVGEINKTFYGYTQQNLFDAYSVCDLTFAQQNKTICQDLGCSYGRIDRTGFSQINDIIDIIGDLASFNVDLDIPENYEWMFSFVFFYIPLFMLILAIYFAIPIIH